MARGVTCWAISLLLTCFKTDFRGLLSDIRPQVYFLGQDSNTPPGIKQFKASECHLHSMRSKIGMYALQHCKAEIQSFGHTQFHCNFKFKFNFSGKSFKFWIQSSEINCPGDLYMLRKNIIVQNRKDLSSHVPGTLLGTLTSLFWSTFLASCWSYRLTYPTCLSCPTGSHYVSMLTCLVVIVLPQPETFVVLPIFLPWVLLLLLLSLFSFLGFVCFWDRVSL